MAQVSSPHVFGVHDVGEDDDGPFLCLEAVQGESLRRVLHNRGRLDPAACLQLGLELSSALAALHLEGLVHGNVGVSQVFLDAAGHSKLAGFALARRPDGKLAGLTIGQAETNAAADGDALRPAAPEACSGVPLHPSMDQYLLARLLLQGLVGAKELPRESTSDEQILELRPDLPAPLAAALARAMEIQPEARYSDLTEFAVALQQALPLASPLGASGATAPTSSLRLRLAKAAAVALTLAAVAYFGWDGFFAAPVDDIPRGGRTLTENGAVLNSGYGDSHALVIGINDYSSPDWDPLAQAEADAEAVAAYLVENGGFAKDKVTLLKGSEATRERIREVLLDDFTDEQQVGPEDRVLVFFAGHGEQLPTPGTEKENSVGYLIPYDAKQDKTSSFLSHDILLSACNRIPAKHVLLLLDCCYSGWASLRGTKGTLLFEDATQNPVRQVIAAGAPGQKVADQYANSGHSPFTFFLLKALNSKLGQPDRSYLTASEIAVYLKRAIGEDPTAQQIPSWTDLSGSGDFVFEFHPPGEETVDSLGIPKEDSD